MSLKLTPLHPSHIKYGGKLIDFGGWELPIEFSSGIIAEHHRVRQKAGLFDVSHMGEIEVKGEKAEELVQKLITNDASRLVDQQICYSLMCYQDGTIVDDLLVYKYNQQHYLLVVNAANTEKDFSWIKYHSIAGAEITNVSQDWAQLALQGPLAQKILQKLCDIDLNTIKYYWFAPQVRLVDKPCLVSRTGYTGEDGFEIYLNPADAEEVWEAILKAGGDEVAPIGLGARDTLRFEAKLPLYGQEIAADINPLEAGLGFFVKLDKSEFIGRDALLKEKLQGVARKLVEFVMVGRGIPRSHYQVEKNGEVIGQVTTGSFAPTLNKNIGLALVDAKFSDPETELNIIIRDKPVVAKVGRGIFYKRGISK
ncbi:MAG: glycine cleavage system aminomethyltransferase GcvT [Methylocystaceae bacterium]